MGGEVGWFSGHSGLFLSLLGKDPIRCTFKIWKNVINNMITEE